MDFALTEDQEAFVASARGFARDRLLPNAGDWDRDGIFPAEALREAAALGFAGIYVDEQRLVAARRGVDLRGTGRRRSIPSRVPVDPQHGLLDDRALRQCRTARPLSAAPADLRAVFQLLPDRTGCRQRRRRPAHPRGGRGQCALQTERQQGVHLRRRPVGHLPDHGAHRRRRAARRVLHDRREGHARIVVRQAGTQDGLEQSAHQHRHVRGLSGAGGQPPRRRRRGVPLCHVRTRRRADQHRRLLAGRRPAWNWRWST